MRVLVGIDDTDVAGGATSTARLARELGETLNGQARFIGSLGHILFSGAKATTNNKASCVVLDCEGTSALDDLFERIVDFVEWRAALASSPGIVMCSAKMERLVKLGWEAAWREIRMDEVVPLLVEHRFKGFGSQRGLIGAAAAIGLTARGWSGRWLEFGNLRRFERAVQVRDLTAQGILTVSIETDAEAPAPDDWVDTHGWLRPQLIAGTAALPLHRIGDGLWEMASVKSAKEIGPKRASPSGNKII
jgi:tRNA(Ile2) C34 agmatinyltransferase TiaS